MLDPAFDEDPEELEPCHNNHDQENNDHETDLHES